MNPAGVFAFIVAPIILVVAVVSMSLIAAGTSPCVETGALGFWPVELTGWYDNVKCYDGQVVDYR